MSGVRPEMGTDAEAIAALRAALDTALRIIDKVPVAKDYWTDDTLLRLDLLRFTLSITASASGRTEGGAMTEPDGTSAYAAGRSTPVGERTAAPQVGDAVIVTGGHHDTGQRSGTVTEVRRKYFHVRWGDGWTQHADFEIDGGVERVVNGYSNYLMRARTPEQFAYDERKAAASAVLNEHGLRDSYGRHAKITDDQLFAIAAILEAP